VIRLAHILPCQKHHFTVLSPRKLAVFSMPVSSQLSANVAYNEASDAPGLLCAFVCFTQWRAW
jgi:hypothetical protein